MTAPRSILNLLFLLIFIGGMRHVTAHNAPQNGDFVAQLGRLHLTLHLEVSDDAVSATLDSVDENAYAIACTEVKLQGNQLSFAVPAIHGTWQGNITPAGAALVGTWNQGTPTPLTFILPADTPSPID